jgi:superfamily II DNA or RNA helicase
MADSAEVGKRSGPVLQVDGQCLLKNISSPLFAALQEKLTIANPGYQAAKKYGRWVGKNFPQKLFFYSLDESGSGIVFPRGFAAQAVSLCRRYMGQGPAIDDRRRRLPEVDFFTFQGKLRPYQEEALEAILQKHFGVLVAGTGSGKTVVALAAIAARLQPALILVHSRELMYQWEERAAQFLGLKAGLIGDGRYDIQPLSIAIVNTARKRLDELIPRFGHLLVDECHRVPATQFIQHRTGFNYRFRGNYQALMSALTKNEERNLQITDDIVAEARNTEGSILVVSDRVAHCSRLAALLAVRGVPASLLTGKQAAAERSAIVGALHRGEVKVLVSTLQLVGEGFDAPGLATLFLTTPIKFTGRLRQVIGRILRPAAGKQARVFDYVDDNVGVLRNSARIRFQTYEKEN